MNLAPTPAPSNASVAPMPGGSAADLPPEEPAAAEPEPANEPEPAADGAADGGSAASTVEEEVTRRGMNLTITWAPLSLPKDLDAIPAKAGIYVVLVGGVPTYVGMSKSLLGRWKVRLQGIKSALKPITLWCGVLNGTGGVSLDEALRGAEQAAIRLLKRYSPSSKLKLDNAQSIQFFRVKAGGRQFVIRHPLPRDLIKGVELDSGNRTASFDRDKSVLTIEAGGTSPEYLSPWRARRP
ncbi:MAG: hypothetical protein IPN34_16305 [Planctomycetes bacterium]|nr:hypothetical protein [Planctomycetota bacterium]